MGHQQLEGGRLSLAGVVECDFGILTSCHHGRDLKTRNSTAIIADREAENWMQGFSVYQYAFIKQHYLSQQYSIKDTIIGQKLVVIEEDEELL